MWPSETRNQVGRQGHHLYPVTRPRQLKVRMAGPGLQLPDTSLTPWPGPDLVRRTYFSRRLCNSFLISASSISESLSLLM